MMKTSLCLLAAALALLVAVPDQAAAKKKGSRKTLVVTVDGKKLRPTPRTIDFSAGGGTIGFAILGQKIPGRRGTIKTLYVACATLWPPPVPSDLPACVTNYSEVNISQPTAGKYWLDLPSVLGGNTTTVTVESWDGTRVSGRFTAAPPASAVSPGLAPVTIQGTFAGPVRFGDPSR